MRSSIELRTYIRWFTSPDEQRKYLILHLGRKTVLKTISIRPEPAGHVKLPICSRGFGWTRVGEKIERRNLSCTRLH